MYSTPAKWLPSSRINRHVRPPYRRKDAECITGRVLDGGVAMDGADAEKSKGGVVRSEEDGKGVL